VPQDYIKQYGAVSEQVAQSMAEGVRNLLKTDYALSTTGVAGPAGGTEEKPVGTVWIGVSDKQGAFATRFLFGKDRQTNIEYSSAAALNALRKVLSAF
jgi:nicotinamide-nucleotide amidase